MKLLFVALSIWIAGCTNSLPPSEWNLSDAAKDVRYFKDKHGICYAAITSQSWEVLYILAFTSVPCEKIGG